MQKKTMKNNVYILLGTLLLFGLMPIISAGGETWISYGNGYFPAHQSQYETGYSFFDDVVNTQTSTYSGQSQFYHPTQPLVSSFGKANTLYAIVSSGNYLRIFDKNLNLYTEEYIGMASMGQLGAIDWNSDGHIDVAGYWRENATLIHFKVFEINHTTQLFSEIYNHSFPHPATNGVTGVRCDSDTCYTILYDTAGVGTSTYWTDLQISKSTGVSAHLLYASKQPYTPIEPPSFDDYNNDGKRDFIVFSQDHVAVYNEDGIILQNWTYPNTVGTFNYVKSAKFFNADASPYMKIAIAREIPYQTSSSGQCTGNYACVRLDIKNIVDGTNAVTVEPLSAGSSSGGNPRFQGLAIRDYNNDGYDDIWITASRLGTSPVATLDIYKGDGTSFYQSSFIDDEYFGSNYPSNSLTLARMDDDSQYEAIIYSGGALRIWSPALDDMVYTSSLSATSGQAGCVPVDLTYSGALDLLCADTNSMELLSSNFSNQNSYITQVAYDPSTLVAVNQTLTVIITAVDPESDNIFYRHRCRSSENWSIADGSNTKECVYDAVGSYDLVVGARDGYRDDYVTFLQTITVTSTGAVCDNDFICEASQGETYLSCPNDCASPEQEELPDTTTATGGMPLPTTLVDTNNVNKGLLPEIYYGTLGFMSSVLSPTILVVFVIFFALIMLSIGSIIRKIGEKASMGGR